MTLGVISQRASILALADVSEEDDDSEEDVDESSESLAKVLFREVAFERRFLVLEEVAFERPLLSCFSSEVEGRGGG